MVGRKKINGESVIVTDGPLTWEKQKNGNWETRAHGATWELEKRRRSPGDTPDTGWYLYTYGAEGGHFGEWCGSRIIEASDAAAVLVQRYAAELS